MIQIYRKKTDHLKMVQFVGGEESANEIIEWARSWGVNAVWAEAGVRYERPVRDGVEMGDFPEQLVLLNAGIGSDNLNVSVSEWVIWTSAREAARRSVRSGFFSVWPNEEIEENWEKVPDAEIPQAPV